VADAYRSGHSAAMDDAASEQNGSRTEGGEALPETSGDTIQSATAAWYAIWTRSNCEHLVAQQLAAKGFSPFLPEIHTRSIRRGKAALVRAPMFPGYLFVRQAMDKRCYVDMLGVRGVVRILEDGWTRLTPVPDADVTAIQRIVEADVPAFGYPHLSGGERVTIVEGPLAGLEGVFLQNKTNRGSFAISIDLLGRSVAVELDRAAVVPISSHRAA
jgi:transcription antitermination factor NusG